MNFRVETAGLRAAKRRLTELGDDTSTARTYAATHLNISGGDNGVLFVHVDNVCDDVRAKVYDVLDRLDRLLTNFGAELSAAADWYDGTDLASLRRLDAQVPRDTLPAEERYDRAPVVDTVPEDPGTWTPPEDPFGLEDGEMILAPGPLGPDPGNHGGLPSA